MKHFFRTSLTPAQVIEAADEFFPTLQLTARSVADRVREFSGDLGKMVLSARPEGGHYTFVEVSTDQIGESRLDRNVKRFFVKLHRLADPRHKLEAAY
jgi:hypothetical protein